MSPFVSLILWNTVLAGLLGGFVFLAQQQSWLKSRPGLAHFLWLTVLLKLAVPPVFNVPIPTVLSNSLTATGVDIGGPLYSPEDNVAASITVDSDVTRRSPSWTLVLASVAVLGTVAILLAGVRRSRRIARLVRLGKSAPEWLQETVDDLANDIGVQRHVTALTIDGCMSPFLWVTINGPAVVIPSVLVERWKGEDLQLILRHEIQHYARKDHWTNLFSLVVGALLWWNPVAWWARHELRFAQELCCDASVLASDSRQRRRYAEALLQTIDFITSDESSVPVPTTAFGSCSTFKRRIEMISEKNLVNGVPHLARLILLPIGALVIAISPAFAHDDDQADTLADMRGEIRELRAAINDLQSTILKLANNSRFSERDRDDGANTRLTRDRLFRMAEDARLNDVELVTLLRLGDSVDGNPRQFERLMYNDDINEKQKNVLRKLFRDDHRHEEGGERRERKIVRLNREALHKMAERAELGEDQKDVLFQLAESVDFNRRQFERLRFNDDLNERQAHVLRKLWRVADDHRSKEDSEDRPDQRIVRLTREGLNKMAERFDLNENERHVLFQLAERVDLNALQFERLFLSDELNRAQRRVLNKLRRDREKERDRDRDREREDRERDEDVDE